MKKVILFVITFFMLIHSQAQHPELFKACPQSGWNAPEPGASINNNLFIRTWSNTYNTDLWITNGDTSSTRLFQTFPGTDGGVNQIVRFNNRLYFAAYDSVNGNSLWVTDGSEAGTQLVWSNGFSPDKAIDNLSVFGNFLFFQTNQSYLGTELWYTDGTTENTGRSELVNAGGYGIINYYCISNNKIFIVSDNAQGTSALWVSNGVDSNPVMLSALNSFSPQIDPMDTLNNLTLFFATGNGEMETDLWVTDGTVAGTQMLQHVDSSPGVYTPEMTYYKGRYYFSGRERMSTVWNIWVTDGTPLGTKIFKTYTENAAFGPIAYGYSVMDNKLYFMANDIYGASLYQTDGTDTNVRLVKTIENYPYAGGYENFTAFNHHLYFNTWDTALQDSPLWMSDGTDSGTFQIKVAFGNDSAILVPAATFQAFNGDLYFGALALYGDNHRVDLWRIAGPSLSENPSSVVDITDNRTLSVYPNPANNSIRILNTDLTSEAVKIEIFNCLGQSVYSSLTAQNEISISQFAAGVYLLRYELNNQVQSCKFVKQ